MIGILSHLQGQAKALLRWLGSSRVSHFIYVRMFDDTNIWTSPHKKILDDGEEQEELIEDDPEAASACSGKNSGRQGRKRVSPALTMIQYLTLRRLSSATAIMAGEDCMPESARIFCPCQILPKACCNVISNSR